MNANETINTVKFLYDEFVVIRSVVINFARSRDSLDDGQKAEFARGCLANRALSICSRSTHLANAIEPDTIHWTLLVYAA